LPTLPSLPSLPAATLPPLPVPPPAPRAAAKTSSIWLFFFAVGLFGAAVAVYLLDQSPPSTKKSTEAAASGQVAEPAVSAQAVASGTPGSSVEALAASAPLPAANIPSPPTEPAGAASADPAVEGDAGSAASSGEDLPLPTGAVITPGQGLLDIETGGREAIFVDGVELGRGPFLRLTIAPGVHDVRLRAHGEEKIKFAMVRAARRTRLPFSSTWAR
jgi:hypothetical protein